MDLHVQIFVFRNGHCHNSKQFSCVCTVYVVVPLKEYMILMHHHIGILTMHEEIFFSISQVCIYIYMYRHYPNAVWWHRHLWNMHQQNRYLYKQFVAELLMDTTCPHVVICGLKNKLISGWCLLLVIRCHSHRCCVRVVL